MNFRRLVRSPQWQSDFLSQPLAQRQETARTLRNKSEQLKQSVASYADLDTLACCDWLHSANATTLIHGHTHQRADHDLPNGLKRITLSDWDATAIPPRAEILRLTMPPPGTSQAKGTVERLSAHQIMA
jgi:UDP-2,3-diacylglucosamine hydrolase